MIKEITIGLVCLFCMSALFNKASVNKLERKIEELEIISIHLEEKLLIEGCYIDSLEQRIINLQLQNKYDN